MLHTIPIGLFNPNTGYTISQAMLFDNTASYLSWVPASAATDIDKWTVSFWKKRAGNDVDAIFSNNDGSGAYTAFYFGLNLADSIYLGVASGGGSQRVLETNGKYRDPSGWDNFVVAYDNNNATAALRLRVWHNGVEITSFATDQRSSIAATDATGWMDNGRSLQIGRDDLVGRYFGGYLTEFHSIDGQVLSPTDFGELVDGIWVPIAYTGTYGTNGFYLDGSSANDQSGNGNNWTNSGVSFGVLDSPTDSVANGVGNFCTLNPLDTRTTGTLSNGNLTTTGNAAVTMRPDTGQWYYEKDGVGVSYDADISGQFDPVLTSGAYNFGQNTWLDTGPTGTEKALNTVNLLQSFTTSGSYTGNGSADGVFVYLGGKPATFNVSGGGSYTLGGGSAVLDFLSNGVKFRSTTDNATSTTYNFTATLDTYFADNNRAEGN